MSEKVKDLNQLYTNLFKENKEIIESLSSKILNEKREEALFNFNQKGIPTKKTEDYKYSEISNAFDYNYSYNFQKSSIKVNLEDIFKCDVPELDTENIILLNGGYYGDEQMQSIEEKAYIGSFKAASKQFPELFEKYYNNIANKNESLVSLNTAFATDGIFLFIPDNVVIEKPIQVINILLSEVDTFVQARNLFIIGKNSSINLIVCDHTLSANKFLSNYVTEVYLDENSGFDYNNLQNEHNGSSKVSTVFFKQEKNSVLNSKIITLHGGQIRNNLYVDLVGKNADSNLYGLYLVDKWQHIDNYTDIKHLSPECKSKQLFKGILDDSSIGAFNGKVYVKKNAQKTFAYQANNNILLTNEAKIYSKPQLEIYADDVKCSHGSTVGQIDENALFYMRARGISEKEARMLLLYGFTHEIIKEIKVEALKDRINNLVEKRLRGELSRCNSCVINCC